MNDKDLLKGKKILIVDDEIDILESIKDLLTMCEVETASTFEQASELLINGTFDIAILDIMGVNGHKLLEIANEQNITAVMLTAHALSPEETIKAHKGGAASYIPKEEMINITIYLKDVLEAKALENSPWLRWMDRFADFYMKKFGPDWKNKDIEFWRDFPN